jgi:predicted ester cyclase
MRNSRALCLIAVVCAGLTLTLGAQKKPALTAPAQSVQPQNRPQPQLAQEHNKVPVQQLYQEMFTNGRYELESQVFAPNCVVHFGNRAVPLREAVAEGKGWKNAAPNGVMQITQISSDGDFVTVRWMARGTHTGQGHGLKPTGRPVNMQGVSRFKVVNGKIVEAFNEEYRPELFRQLGVSKTQASLFFAGEEILAVLNPIIPDRLYDWLK